MQPTSCDEIQLELSNALDEGPEIPASLLTHTQQCSACAAFLEAWTGGLDRVLSHPLPPADLTLRQRLLELPETSLRQRAKHPYRHYLSTLAAAIVFGFFAYVLIEVTPTEQNVCHPSKSLAQQEVTALKSDLRQAYGAFRKPARALQRAIRP